MTTDFFKDMPDGCGHPPHHESGDAVVVTGNDVIKGVVKFQGGVPAIAGTFKSHT
jgi:hypothetical protein